MFFLQNIQQLSESKLMVWIHEHRFIEQFSADNMHNVVPLQSFQPENNLAQRYPVFKLKTKLNFRSFCLLMDLQHARPHLAWRFVPPGSRLLAGKPWMTPR